jgi:quinolinate synthase
MMNGFPTPPTILWNSEESIEDVRIFGTPQIDPGILDEIRELREEFGCDLVILGHHYQRDELLEFADMVDDSLALSIYAGKLKDAKFVIFLGIMIMAETADMLTPEETRVFLPDHRAGCTLGDMAPIGSVEKCWDELGQVIDPETIMPICYINAGADVKGFTGKYGGPCCTSSNADKIIEWGLNQREKVLFLPDYNLGRNSAYEMGIPEDKTIKWDPTLPLGGNSVDEIRHASLIIWNGHCSVHAHFKPEQIDEWKKSDPSMNVIVHPEVNFDVFEKADYWGSTTRITEIIGKSRPGSKWLVATEHNMVNRLANEMKSQDKKVYGLAKGFAPMCTPMFRITAEAFLETLKAIKLGDQRLQVVVDSEIRENANRSLELMFEITE